MTVYEMIAEGLKIHLSWKHRNPTYITVNNSQKKPGATMFYQAISAVFIYFMLYNRNDICTRAKTLLAQPENSSSRS